MTDEREETGDRDTEDRKNGLLFDVAPWTSYSYEDLLSHGHTQSTVNNNNEKALYVILDILQIFISLGNLIRRISQQACP